MNHPMRRKAQQTSEEEALALLNACSFGVLSLVDPDGRPYGVPLSFAWEDDRIFFHCARAGRKLEAIKHCDQACFTAVAQDEVIPEKYTTYFKSVIVQGTIRVLEEPSQREHALFLLARRYWPQDSLSHAMKAIQDGLPRAVLLEMKMESLSGKVAKELVI